LIAMMGLYFIALKLESEESEALASSPCARSCERNIAV